MLTILYTGSLRGDLERLPRLYTFLQNLRHPPQPPGRTLLLDLGDSCAPDVWHCAITGGRSTLIVLDAMGCHAARVELSDENRRRLRANLLSMALVDAEHPWVDGELVFTAAAVLPPPDALTVVLAPADSTRLDGRMLRLAGVSAGQVGLARLDDAPALLDHAIYDLPPAALPDPTITAAVDFVLAEARALQRKRAE